MSNHLTYYDPINNKTVKIDKVVEDTVHFKVDGEDKTLEYSEFIKQYPQLGVMKHD